jgi:hypothetical protein
MILNNYRVQSFSKYDKWYLLSLTVIGAVIRIIYHNNRPFVNDEIGTLIYMEKSVTFLLSHFESWLTMNYFILVEKFMAYVFGHSQISLCLIPMVASIITIPLTAVLARMVTSTKVSLISAALVAMNPYLIYFSGIIRSYSLLTALSIIVIIVYLRWYSHRTYKNGLYVSLACYALLLSHLNGMYILSYIMLRSCVDLLWTFKKGQKSNILTLVIPLGVCVLAAGISYVKIFPELLVWGVQWHDTSPTGVAYIPLMLSRYFADGYYGWLSAGLLISSIFIAYKHSMSVIELLPIIVLPILLISIQGISHFPWAYARFLIFAVPILVIFIAEGICFYAGRFVHMTTLATCAVTIVLIITWVPNLQNMFNRKWAYPWNQVGSFINSTYQENDIILYSGWNISHHMYPYLSTANYAKFMLIDYSEKDYKNINGKVFFITTKPFVNSQDCPGYTFGNIKIILYSQQSYMQLLVTIRNDILASIKPGEVSPDLTDYYKDIWELNKKVNPESNYLMYYQLYMLCLNLTERQRNMPHALECWESESMAKLIMNRAQ